LIPEALPVIVIDTVGFVRFVLNPGGPWGGIFGLHRSHYRTVMSEPLASEMSDVMSRSKIRERFHAGEVTAATIMEVLGTARWVELSDIPQVCRDPKDDMVLATAVAGSADFIATEDKDLLDLVEYEGIRVMTGVELLGILRG
jgi:putative PIN family toxin of toxin-antitoxin system